MAELEQISINSVFDEDPADMVDFEIAFAAFLSTFLLSLNLSQSLSITAKFVGLSLLFVTLIRRIMRMNGNNQPKLRRSSMLAVDVLSVSAFFLIFYRLSEILVSILPIPLEPITLSSIGITLFVAVFLISYEKIFGDMSTWAVVTLYDGIVVGNEDSELGKQGKDLILNFYEGFNPERFPSEVNEKMQTLSDSEIGDDSLVTRTASRIGMLLGLGLYLGILFLSYYLTKDIRAGAFFIAALMMSLPIEFLYSRYGYSTYQERTDGGWRYLFTVTFLIAFYILYYRPF